MLLVAQIQPQLTALLRHYGLECCLVPDTESIPGSYWGTPEAGLIANRLYVRNDTPVHSALHEACHYICMDQTRRDALHTDALGDDAEECAVCYLQIVLAQSLGEAAADGLCGDMDKWGYSFRLGSARQWFENDAADAKTWLQRHGLLDAAGAPTWQTRT